jgi:general secretion pathway protein A
MYLSHYRLKTEPFQLTPDPQFLQLADAHRSALSVLFQGILMRKGFLVLTGPIGTGKTTLLHAVMHILSDHSFSKSKLSTAFIVNPTLTRDEFLEFILDEFEVPCASTSKPRRLAALHQMLLATQRRGSTAVLVIDEAHLLTMELLEEIRLLGNTDTYREKLLQVVLSAQPELHTVLGRKEQQALRQRIAGWCQLRPLSLPETRAYIAERLHVAGLQGNSPFLPVTVEKIFGHSHGVPRLINLLCDQCLVLGASAQQAQIDPQTVENAVNILGLNTEPPAPPEPIPQVPTVAVPQMPAASVSSNGGGNGTSSASTTPGIVVDGFQSSVDMLIQAMKQRRAKARGQDIQ